MPAGDVGQRHAERHGSIVKVAQRLFPGGHFTAIQFVARDGTTVETPFSVASRDPASYQLKLNRRSQFKMELPEGPKAAASHSGRGLLVQEIRFL